MQNIHPHEFYSLCFKTHRQKLLKMFNIFFVSLLCRSHFSYSDNHIEISVDFPPSCHTIPFCFYILKSYHMFTHFCITHSCIFYERANVSLHGSICIAEILLYNFFSQKEKNFVKISIYIIILSHIYIIYYCFYWHLF